MRRMIFQLDEELAARTRRRANERGVSVAQVIREALASELGGSDKRPPRPTVIGIGKSRRTDLSKLADAPAYKPEPWASS
jgi:Ribbon-helix-helix protein, copG family